MIRSNLKLSFLYLIVLAFCAGQATGKVWYPVEVDVWQPPFNKERKRVQKTYVPLKKAQKKWNIGVFIPHLKDAYWLGVNYGLIDEARRVGVNVSLYSAGSVKDTETAD